MRADFETNRESGAIMVISLILTLVMTTMGIGLFYVANRTSDQIEANTNRSETLYSAETCIDQATRWITKEALTDPHPCKTPAVNKLGDVCYTIGASGNKKTMDDTAWRPDKSSEPKYLTKAKARMLAHEYTCTVALTGITSGASTIHYYKVESTGLGPQVGANPVRSDIVATVSVTIGDSKAGSDAGQSNEH